MATVTIACSLPGGLVLSLPDAVALGLDPYASVTLNGAAPTLSGLSGGDNAGVGFTEVDADFWSQWIAAYATNPIITSGSIWEVSSP